MNGAGNTKGKIQAFRERTRIVYVSGKGTKKAKKDMGAWEYEIRTVELISRLVVYAARHGMEQGER